MKNTIALLGFVCSIKPSDITIDPDAPVGMVFEGMLGRMQCESIAAELVYASQQVGVWVGVDMGYRDIPNTDFHRMIERGYLVEAQCGSHWFYHLSLHALVTLYQHQSEDTIRSLERELNKRRKATLFQILWKRFQRWWYAGYGV